MNRRPVSLIQSLFIAVLLSALLFCGNLVLRPDWKRVVDVMPRFVQNVVTYRLVSMDQYLAFVQNRIKYRWRPPLYPHHADLAVRFGVLPNGQLSQVKLLQSSGSQELDQSAMDAVSRSAPFPPIPKRSHEKNVQIEMTFEYNVVKTVPESQIEAGTNPVSSESN